MSPPPRPPFPIPNFLVVATFIYHTLQPDVASNFLFLVILNNARLTKCRIVAMPPTDEKLKTTLLVSTRKDLFADTAGVRYFLGNQMAVQKKLKKNKGADAEKVYVKRCLKSENTL